jgi:hypothetical protein
MVPVSMLETLMLGNFSVIASGSWNDVIPEAFRLVFTLTLFFASLLVLAGVLYLAGLVVVGRKRTLFGEAAVISLVGTVLSVVFFMFVPYGLLALFLSIVVWLLLIKRFYKTGWFGAIAVGILALVVFLVVVIFAALVFGVLSEILGLFSFVVITL